MVESPVSRYQCGTRLSLRQPTNATREIDTKLSQLHGPAALTAQIGTIVADNARAARRESQAADLLAARPGDATLTNARGERLTAPIRAAHSEAMLLAARSDISGLCAPMP